MASSLLPIECFFFLLDIRFVCFLRFMVSIHSVHSGILVIFLVYCLLTVKIYLMYYFFFVRGRLMIICFNYYACKKKLIKLDLRNIRAIKKFNKFIYEYYSIIVLCCKFSTMWYMSKYNNYFIPLYDYTFKVCRPQKYVCYRLSKRQVPNKNN